MPQALMAQMEQSALLDSIQVCQVMALKSIKQQEQRLRKKF
jgi:hypothetical protein